jgi:hypothetical protein
MDRRNSIRLILAAAIAPAFVAKGLMRVKPVVVPDLSGKAIQMIQPFVVHPAMYEQLKEAEADLSTIAGIYAISADLSTIAGIYAISDGYLGMEIIDAKKYLDGHWCVRSQRMTKNEAIARWSEHAHKIKGVVT